MKRILKIRRNTTIIVEYEQEWRSFHLTMISTKKVYKNKIEMINSDNFVTLIMKIGNYWDVINDKCWVPDEYAAEVIADLNDIKFNFKLWWRIDCLQFERLLRFKKFQGMRHWDWLRKNRPKAHQWFHTQRVITVICEVNEISHSNIDGKVTVQVKI